MNIDLPVFGLMVTAEAYFSVDLPSEVVVLENEVRPPKLLVPLNEYPKT